MRSSEARCEGVDAAALTGLRVCWEQDEGDVQPPPRKMDEALRHATSPQ